MREAGIVWVEEIVFYCVTSKYMQCDFQACGMGENERKLEGSRVENVAWTDGRTDASGMGMALGWLSFFFLFVFHHI